MSNISSFHDKWSNWFSVNFAHDRPSQNKSIPKYTFTESNPMKGPYPQNKSLSKFPRFDFALDNYKMKSADVKQREWTRTNSKVKDYLDKSLVEWSNWTNGNTAAYNSTNMTRTDIEIYSYTSSKPKEYQPLKPNNYEHRRGVSKNEGQLDWEKIRTISRTNSSTFNRKMINLSVATPSYIRNSKDRHWQKEIAIFKTKLKTEIREQSPIYKYWSHAKPDNSNTLINNGNCSSNPTTKTFFNRSNYNNSSGGKENFGVVNGGNTNMNSSINAYTRMTRNSLYNGNEKNNSMNLNSNYKNSHNAITNTRVWYEVKRNTIDRLNRDINMEKDAKQKKYAINLDF